MLLNTKLITGFVAIAVTGISILKPFSTEKYFDWDTKKSAVLVIESPGKEIYLDFCIQCHGANGKGDSKNFPPLDASDWLKNKRTESIAAVKFGQNGEIMVNKIKYNNAMPAMGLSNQEVADVMNYIMTSWSNKQSKIVTEREVAAIKK
ncbi:MAG: cytochrome c [Flavobacterium micromati]|nr:cytochrome c [Flavobacterium micromati]